jgi:hypothetical protein
MPILLISNAHFQVTMSPFSLLGLTPCSQSDADNPLYCVLGAREDCCNSGVGRISIPSWDINKRQEYASSSGSFDSGYGYHTLSTTSTTAGSTIRVTRTVSWETSSQALSPSEAPSLPTTSDTITTSPSRPILYPTRPKPDRRWQYEGFGLTAISVGVCRVAKAVVGELQVAKGYCLEPRKTSPPLWKVQN